MTEAYKQQITKTFRDDAIRSVLLIDDEYMSYPDLSEQRKRLNDEFKEVFKLVSAIGKTPLEQARLNTLTSDITPAKSSSTDLVQHKLQQIEKFLTKDISENKVRTPIAEQFVKFFHEYKYICDVENETGDLKTDKIRKSDLIILDYLLEHQDQKPSLRLLSELSMNPHMNMVVVYTSENIEKVWLETALTLRGSESLDPADFFNDNDKVIWDEFSDEYEDVWLELSKENQASYILGKREFFGRVIAEFYRNCQNYNRQHDVDVPRPQVRHIEYLIEKGLKKFNILEVPISGLDIQGKFKQWIQAGDVFISLCEKDDEDKNQPNKVWDNLEVSLHDWYPSFYRVVLSELQNCIEDSNFSMSKALDKSLQAQISFLWNIINKNDADKLNSSKTILGHLLEDLSADLLKQSTNSLPEFVKATANKIKVKLPTYVPFDEDNPELYKNFMKDTIKVAENHFKGKDAKVSDSELLNIVHAYNEQISVSKFNPTYITTGMILKNVTGDVVSWYMCVTPSCDTVPTQNKGDLSPHRLLTFAKLEKVGLKIALPLAEESSHVFITDGSERLAFNVIHATTKQPKLVKFIIKDHENNILDKKQGKIALVLQNVEGNVTTLDLNMVPIALLKPSYAARYQAVQSHHEGRIGVDFIGLDISAPKPNKVVEKEIKPVNAPVEV